MDPRKDRLQLNALPEGCLAVGVIVLVLSLVCSCTPSASAPFSSTPSETPVLRRNRADTTFVTRNDVLRMLVGRARRQLRQGQIHRAEATVDRVLNLRSDDPRAWYLLARVRKHQVQLQQAEILAQKSLALSGQHDVGLAIKNWELIARVRDLRGRREGSRRARDHAERLRGR